MSDAPKHQEETEIQPLSDETLEDVAGGYCSLNACSNGDIANP
jgi:hypothetical protein